MKDYAYAALFDKKDLSSLYQLAERIRATHDNSLIDDFNLKCQKKIDDHNPVLEIGNQNIEFEQVSKADDLIVTTGITQCLDQILGISIVRWQYMARGTGTTAPVIGNTTLVTEVTPRVDMNTAGWREFASSTLRFAGIFGELLPTSTVNEAGVFTASSGGIMLNRNAFSANPIAHTINLTGFVISSIIEFVPVM